MSRYHQGSTVLAVLATSLMSSAAMAQDALPSQAEMWRIIQDQARQLAEQRREIDALKRQIDELQKELDERDR